MPDTTPNVLSAATLAQALALTQARVGKQRLGDDELLVLCAEQVVRSYTRDEKGYR